MNSTLTYRGITNKEKSWIRRMGNKDRQIFHGSLTVPVKVHFSQNASQTAQLIKHERKFLTQNGM